MQYKNRSHQLAKEPVVQAHNEAARQAVASLVKNHGFSAIEAARAVFLASTDRGYQLGNLYSVGRKALGHEALLRYAKAVESNGASGANKYWELNGYARVLISDSKEIKAQAATT